MALRSVSIHLPGQRVVDQREGKHRFYRIGDHPSTVAGDVEFSFSVRGRRPIFQLAGIWIVTRRNDAPADAEDVLLTDQIHLDSDGEINLTQSDVKWIRPKPVRLAAPDLTELALDATASWRGHQIFQESDQSQGLRKPQLGALHALLAHWSISNDSATVVLPTGVGKTDTMIAALLCKQYLPLLVIVPSRALREQTARKFQTLGKVREIGLCPNARNPTIALIDGGIRNEQELEFILSCNVIVSTIASINEANEAFANRIADEVGHVYFDEAHHIPASSWTRFRSRFELSRVSQFTATPYRNDGKLLPGRRVYHYPLRAAQADGLFTSIQFRAVAKYDELEGDIAIRDIALERLRSDIDASLDHVLMVRTNSVERAERLLALYNDGSDFRCRLLHSGLKKRDRDSALNDLWQRECRVIVCVDMLGEGFDLPALKIAALHDSHQSLGVTLQFVGRFTRDGANVGEATAIANIADPKISAGLDRLYAEDSDWNTILRSLADAQIENDHERIDFLAGFDEGEITLSLQNIRPKMSTAVYRAPGGSWQPSALFEDIADRKKVFISANEERRTAVLVTRRIERVSWGEIEELQDITHDLTLIYFNERTELVFIHTSDTRRYHSRFAGLATGVDVRLVEGMEVFKSLDGINRLYVANLGLKSAIGRTVAFTMYAGGNVNEGLTEASFRNRLTSNLFGFGFENGDRASVGCSYKGRIWSYRIGRDISDWVRWCNRVGKKVTDPTIDPAGFLRTRMRVEPVESVPPDLRPIAVEWSANIWLRSEDAVQIRFGLSGAVTLLDVGIDLTDPGEPGNIKFSVFTDTESSEFEVDVSGEAAQYRHVAGRRVEIRLGRSPWVPLGTWLQEEPPIIYFSNGQQLAGKLLLSQPVVEQAYDKSQIDPWDWEGVDPKAESQKDQKRADSIQFRVIQEVLADTHWEIVFDDDSSGEAADIVAIRPEPDRVVIRLYHCKYAHGTVSAQRVDDLYDVCGQAQKSVHWKGDCDRLLEHLAKRESKRISQSRPSRFERGSLEELTRLRRKARDIRVDLEIFIVQPGLSASRLTDDQGEILAAAALYLNETFAVPMYVIGGK